MSSVVSPVSRHSSPDVNIPSEALDSTHRQTQKVIFPDALQIINTSPSRMQQTGPVDTLHESQSSGGKLTKLKVNNVLRKLDEPLDRHLQFLATAFAPTGARATVKGVPHGFNVDIKLGTWRLASFSGAANVIGNEISENIKVTFAATWWLRALAPVIGLLIGTSIPNIEGTLTGVDDHGRLLLSGAAQGFHYIASKPIDAVLTLAEDFQRWDTGVPSLYRNTAEPTMPEDREIINDAQMRSIPGEPTVWFSRKSTNGFRQALIYNGPYRQGVSYGPVVFENFPLSLGARLGLGLHLPI